MSPGPASASLAAASTLARAPAASRRVRISAPPVASAPSAATVNTKTTPLAGSMSLVSAREAIAASSASAPTAAVLRQSAPSEAIRGAMPYSAMTTTSGPVARSIANSTTSTTIAATAQGRERDRPMAFSTTSYATGGGFRPKLAWSSGG